MTADDTEFPRCEICGLSSWRRVYEGPIRAGKYPASVNATVKQCDGCGIERIPASVSLSAETYESDDYRSLLEQDHNVEAYFKDHDALIKHALSALNEVNHRDKTVADIGCAGGALLDHIAGVASTKIAIEPGNGWSDSLKERGYLWYPSTASALQLHRGSVDIVYSVQVIEHVSQPREFLADLYQLLDHGGVAVVSTPNRNDILMELAPEVFPPFFYRVQHRWAFDKASLLECARLAGIIECEVICDHRYNLANALRWIRDSEPGGKEPLGCLNTQIDQMWASWLATVGKSDNLNLIIKK